MEGSAEIPAIEVPFAVPSLGQLNVDGCRSQRNQHCLLKRLTHFQQGLKEQPVHSLL